MWIGNFKNVDLRMVFEQDHVSRGWHEPGIRNGRHRPRRRPQHEAQILRKFLVILSPMVVQKWRHGLGQERQGFCDYYNETLEIKNGRVTNNVTSYMDEHHEYSINAGFSESLDQLCPTLKKHSPVIWRQELLCLHICCKINLKGLSYSFSAFKSFFAMIIRPFIARMVQDL
jgi:hypothetical protein